MANIPEMRIARRFTATILKAAELKRLTLTDPLCGPKRAPAEEQHDKAEENGKDERNGIARRSVQSAEVFERISEK
jgi:hypothetical protein